MAVPVTIDGTRPLACLDPGTIEGYCVSDRGISKVRVRRCLDQMVRGDRTELRAGDRVLRVTWSKPTRSYPSVPTECAAGTVDYADDGAYADVLPDAGGDPIRALRSTLWTLREHHGNGMAVRR